MAILTTGGGSSLTEVLKGGKIMRPQSPEQSMAMGSVSCFMMNFSGILAGGLFGIIPARIAWGCHGSTLDYRLINQLSMSNNLASLFTVIGLYGVMMVAAACYNHLALARLVRPTHRSENELMQFRCRQQKVALASYGVLWGSGVTMALMTALLTLYCMHQRAFDSDNMLSPTIAMALILVPLFLDALAIGVTSLSARVYVHSQYRAFLALPNAGGDEWGLDGAQALDGENGGYVQLPVNATHL